MRYRCITLIFLLLSSSVGIRAQKRLAIVGSSTSACYTTTSSDSCYVFRLYHYYNQAVPNDTAVDNGFAVPGYPCYRGMPSSYVAPYANLQPDPAHNITAALDTHPDVVIVNYPTNGYDSLRIDSIMYCLRTIRDSANIKGVPCFITTTQPRTSAPLFNNAAAKRKLAEIKDSVLAEFGNFAIDFYTGFYNPADSSILPLYDAGDQTHLNDIGHDSLFRRVVAKNIFLATLPATFVYFNTVAKNKVNIVSWSTAREIDVDHYEIQRSADGTGFTPITSVQAINGYANHQYQYNDATAGPGLSYYKIVLVDRDGKKQASPVMKVYAGIGLLSLVKVYSSSSTQLLLNIQNNEAQLVSVQLVNNTGSVIGSYSRRLEVGNNSLYLATPLLSNGIYHVVLRTGKQTLSGSFFKN